MKKYWPILLIILLSVLTFSQMLKFGIFSMQDFHFFRLYEFDKCIKALQIPCRWAPDSGAGYGEPLFNYYGQLVYAFGEIFHLFNFSLIDSLKITFIFSLVGSAIAMFFLARKIWKDNLSAVISSILYLYAPYRAVDVWVRGALPEAFSFIYFPLIILEIENYLETSKKKHLLTFSLLIALLITTHNLSVILFAPFLIIWTIFRFLQIKKIRPFLELLVAGIFAGLLSAFYILPIIFESKFVDINSTTIGYFDWRAHFITINQLFISRFWGYGASVWGPNDGLSLSIGQIQWITPLIVTLIILLKRKLNKDVIIFSVLLSIAILYLFLTHNKSTFIWQTLPFMKYIQFPWRFLGVGLFSLSLASGIIVKQFKNIKVQWILAVVIMLITIFLNFDFFKPDIWYSKSDNYFKTGAKWEEGKFASIGDYWPQFGHQIPNKISNDTYINYFPGWNHKPNQDGLIPAKGAIFSDTPIRTIGNWTTIASFIIWVFIFVKLSYAKNSRKL